MNISRLLLIASLVCGFFIHSSMAAKRYWIGNGSNKNWNTTANWSSTSGGASGASVPSTSDTAYFDGGGLGQCRLDVGISVLRLEIAAAFTDSIKQNNNTITIGGSGFSQAGGVFYGDSTDISMSGAFSLSAGTFRSTKTLMTVSADFTFSGGTFNHNNGTLKFDVSATITGSATLNNLTFYGSSSYTITIAAATTITVNATFTIGGSSSTVMTTINGGNISAKGDINLTGTYNGGAGNATITVNGTVDQYLNGSTVNYYTFLPNFVINKSAGTFFITGFIGIVGNWTYTAGTVNAGTSNITFQGTKTISGTHTLNNVTFYDYAYYTITIAAGSTLTVAGTLNISGSGSSAGATINGGNIDVKKDITLTGTYNGGDGTATITVNGTINQSLVGSTVNYYMFLPNFVINKSSGTFLISGYIGVSGNWTWQAGTVDAGTSTVQFSGTKTISGSHALTNIVFWAPGPSTITIASGTNLTSNGNLSISTAGASSLYLNTGQISVKGNINDYSTSSSTGGTATIVINGTGAQTLTGSGVAGQGRFCNVQINKPSGTLTLADIASYDANLIYTAGTVDGGTSTSVLTGSGTFNPANGSYSVPFYKLFVSSDRTLYGKLTVLNELQISSTQTFTDSTQDIYLAGIWTDNGTFNAVGGNVFFNGSGAQTITKSPAGSMEVYKKLGVNKAGGTVSLNNPVTVNDSLKLTKGVFVATTTNYLKMIANSGVVGGSDSGYVSGVMRKLGNNAFTFPLGSNSLSSGNYHPLSITAPAVATDEFSAEYKVGNPTTAYGTTLSDSVEAVSKCEYWILTRTAGTSNVTPGLGWNSNLCINNSLSDLEVGIWNSAKWYSLGAASRTIVTGTQRGMVTASLAATYTTSPLTFTKNSKSDYALLKKKLDGGYYLATSGVLRFKFDEEYNDGDGLLNFKIIKTSTNADVTPGIQTAFKLVSFGDNRYGYDLSLYGLAAGYYILEVTNEKSEKMFLRFKI